MKKALLSVIALLAVGGTLAWFNRIDLMLFLVKQRSLAEYTVGPNREISWQQGPSEPTNRDMSKPNIVFIVLDDVGINDISTFGGGIAGGAIKTPNIDKLAAESVIFRQAYAGNATCAPSRAMMMTGRYPTRTGYEFTPFPGGQGALLTITNSMNTGGPEALGPEPGTANNIPYENQGLATEEVTVAEILKDRGYHTAHIGKWHMGRSNGMAPNDQGFDESLLMHSGLYMPEDHPGVVNAKLDFDPIDQFLWARMRYSASFNDASNDDPFEPRGYLTDYWTDESIKVIEANKNRPFFLYLAHWGMHTPLQATKEDYEAVGDIQPHRLRVYAGMMRAIDRSIGRIEKALKDNGLSENTIIVLTNDNGGAGYVGLPDINAPYRGWKLTYFEGGLRVPYFVKWPRKLTGGKTIETPVSHIDIMPTLVAATGANMPADVEIDGRNLLPLAMGESDLTARPLFFQSGYYQAVRFGDWKLQTSIRPSKNWLYNLATDPTEQTNLSETFPEKAAELQAMIDAHVAAGRGARYPYSMQAPIWIDKTRADRIESEDEYIYWPN